MNIQKVSMLGTVLIGIILHLLIFFFACYQFTSDLTVLQKNIDRQKKSGKVVLRETISPGGSDADQQNLSYLDSANL